MVTVAGGFNWADEGLRDAAGAPTTHLIGFTTLRAKTRCSYVTRCNVSQRTNEVWHQSSFDILLFKLTNWGTLIWYDSHWFEANSASSLSFKMDKCERASRLEGSDSFVISKSSEPFSIVSYFLLQTYYHTLGVKSRNSSILDIFIYLCHKAQDLNYRIYQ